MGGPVRMAIFQGLLWPMLVFFGKVPSLAEASRPRIPKTRPPRRSKRPNEVERHGHKAGVKRVTWLKLRGDKSILDSESFFFFWFEVFWPSNIFGTFLILLVGWWLYMLTMASYKKIRNVFCVGVWLNVATGKRVRPLGFMFMCFLSHSSTEQRKNPGW